MVGVGVGVGDGGGRHNFLEFSSVMSSSCAKVSMRRKCVVAQQTSTQSSSMHEAAPAPLSLHKPPSFVRSFDPLSWIKG